MPAIEAIQTEITPHLETTDVRFKRILVAIDFSKQTERVLSTATQIAKIFGAELFLVNAATPAVYGTGAEPVPLETFEVNLEIAEARMNELVCSESSLAELQHHQIVAYSMPVDLIQQVIAENDIDVVIVGSHGASGVERLALGSVADAILRTVRCPVLVIGPRAARQSNLFGSILLAASLRTAGLRSAQYAAALAEHFNSKLTLLHIVEPKSHNSVQPELLEDHLLARLQELVPEHLPMHATVTPQVEFGKPGEVIVSFALCKRSSLIVTGARDEKTFSDRTPWSTLAEIIRRAPCPVLCVRGHFN